MPLHFLMLVMFVNTFFAKANYLSKFRLSRVKKILFGGRSHISGTFTFSNERNIWHFYRSRGVERMDNRDLALRDVNQGLRKFFKITLIGF